MLYIAVSIHPWMDIYSLLEERYIKDNYFFEVNTKYISSNVLKISVISRVRIADIFNT